MPKNSASMTINTLPFEQYEHQFAEKVDQLTAKLRPYSPTKLEIFRSPISHYRMRAEFRIWHDQEDIYHIMFDQKTKQRLVIKQFPVASKLINQIMAPLLKAIQPIFILRHKLFQIDYLSTLSGEIMVSMLYHCQLTNEWQQQAIKLRHTLQQQGFNLHIIGRAARQKICLDNDFIDEVLFVAGKNITYRQVENSFTQPNAAVNINMLEWAIDVTQNSVGDLLELYCGNGNFSLALARNFNLILATEISKPSVTAALHNIDINNIDNVHIIRMSAEELTQALNGTRTFNRLKNVDLTNYQCNTVLVDPPRSGLDDGTLVMAQNYPNILYLSCNLDTLVSNLDKLIKTHYIKRLALFDQFPYTHHIECGLFLERR